MPDAQSKTASIAGGRLNSGGLSQIRTVTYGLKRQQLAYFSYFNQCIAAPTLHRIRLAHSQKAPKRILQLRSSYDDFLARFLMRSTRCTTFASVRIVG